MATTTRPETSRGVLKHWVRRALTPGQLKTSRKLYVRLLSRIYSSDLTRLAIIQGTDKWNHHWYMQHYQAHLQQLRWKKLNILEIGVGGGQDPLSGGASLRMWKYFFPRSRVYGIDIKDKSALQERRIQIFRGSQNDTKFLLDVFDRIGSLDIIVDDGSHVNDDVITSFRTLFPLLNKDGIYAVEDTDHSYMPKSGGDDQDFHNPRTIMNLFKNLTDGLNYEALKLLGVAYEPSYFDMNTLSIHFYYNLIIVHKGTEPRQFLKQRPSPSVPILPN